MLVAVCGGIAAYKVCHVVSQLVQRGAGVTVAMTEAAKQFVGTVTFQALSARRVLTDIWAPDGIAQIQHIERTSQADLLLVAPATANMIGKIAAGIADEFVSTLVIGAASPVVLAPAMNDRMWANPVVKRNVAMLADLGFTLVGPAEGWLACRSVGPGRMVEPQQIVDTIVPMLKSSPPKAQHNEAPPS
ncbi:MAG: phosphopantothenoylcysteine decarboxylase [Planctomycetes bacterium]|nr:phosphopantothenoylcysteine decarboxylase [Planctomycetota bacterium]